MCRGFLLFIVAFRCSVHSDVRMLAAKDREELRSMVKSLGYIPNLKSLFGIASTEKGNIKGSAADKNSNSVNYTKNKEAAQAAALSQKESAKTNTASSEKSTDRSPKAKSTTDNTSKATTAKTSNDSATKPVSSALASTAASKASGTIITFKFAPTAVPTKPTDDAAPKASSEKKAPNPASKYKAALASTSSAKTTTSKTEEQSKATTSSPKTKEKDKSINNTETETGKKPTETPLTAVKPKPDTQNVDKTKTVKADPEKPAVTKITDYLINDENIDQLRKSFIELAREIPPKKKRKNTFKKTKELSATTSAPSDESPTDDNKAATKTSIQNEVEENEDSKDDADEDKEAEGNKDDVSEEPAHESEKESPSPSKDTSLTNEIMQELENAQNPANSTDSSAAAEENCDEVAEKEMCISKKFQGKIDEVLSSINNIKTFLDVICKNSKQICKQIYHSIDGLRKHRPRKDKTLITKLHNISKKASDRVLKVSQSSLSFADAEQLEKIKKDAQDASFAVVKNIARKLNQMNKTADMQKIDITMEKAATFASEKVVADAIKAYRDSVKVKSAKKLKPSSDDGATSELQPSSDGQPTSASVTISDDKPAPKAFSDVKLARAQLKKIVETLIA